MYFLKSFLPETWEKYCGDLFPGKDSQSVMAFGLPQFQTDGYLLIFEKDVRKSKTFFADTVLKRGITNQYDNISACSAKKNPVTFSRVGPHADTSKEPKMVI